MKEKWCEACLLAGVRVPAAARSINPDYAKYELCEECAARYDAMLITNKENGVDSQHPHPCRDSGFKKMEYAATGRSRRYREGEVIMKYGGKHYKGCICDICGGLNGKHSQLCACPHCGEKEGKHKPYCHCPQCFESGEKHHQYCECPVCHCLG